MADGDLKKTGVQLVAEGSAEFQRAMQNARGQVAGFGDQGKTTSRSWVQSLGDIRASTVIAMAAITAGIAAAGKAYRATVGEAMDYAREIRQLSSITGQTAEDTSRLVQVFGDFDIETGQITQAMRIMRSQGLVPTMDSIAQLSDRYLALAPGVERVNFLQTTFGRGSAEFAAVLSQGSAALRERAATVESGLVLTQQQLDQAEELRLAQDDLDDAIRSVSLTIGMIAIPAIASWTQELVHNITATRDATSGAEEFERRFGYMEAPTLAEADAMQRAWFEAEHLDHALEGVDGAADGATTAMQLFSDEQLLSAVAADSNSRMIGLEREAIEALRDRNIVITVTTIRREIQEQLRAGQASGTHGMAGYQHGGAFTVGGPEGADRSPVSFMATRGERVIVQPPAAYPAGPTYNTTDSHDQRSLNVGAGSDLLNPFVLKRIINEALFN